MDNNTNQSTPNQVNPNVQSQEYQGNPNQQYQGDPNQQYQGDPNQQYQGDPNQQYQGDPNQQYQGDPNQQYQGDPNQQYQGDPNQQYQGNPNQQYRGNPYQQYQNAPNYTNQTVPKKKKTMFVIIGVVVGVIALVVAAFGYKTFFDKSVNDVDGLTRAMVRTVKEYSSEMNGMVANNNVLKNLSKANNEITLQKIMINDMYNIETVHSKANKRLDIAVEAAAGSSDRGELYLHDRDIIIGKAGGPFLSTTTDTVAKDVRSHLSGYGMLDVYVETVFDNMEFSYDGLTKSMVDKETLVRIGKHYAPVSKKFLDIGDFNVEKNSESYSFEGNNVERNVQKVKIEYDMKMIMGWLQEDLIPTMRNDDDFRELVNRMQGYSSMLNTGADDYDNMLDELEEELDYAKDSGYIYDYKIALEFTLYKGYIIECKVIVEDESYPVTIEASLAIQGEKNLLDDIEVAVVEKYDDMDEENFRVSAKGNHIGKGTFESKVECMFDSTVYDLNITWDPQKKADNLSVRGKDDYGDAIDFEMTLAADGTGVIAGVDIEGSTLEYTLDKLSKLPELPKDTTPLNSVDSYELFDIFGGILG